PGQLRTRDLAPTFCLTRSKKQTAALAATFSDSTCPRCGIATDAVVSLISPSETPPPSWPNSQTASPRKSRSYRLAVACELVAYTGTVALAMHAARSTFSWIASAKCAPMPARSTLLDHANAVPGPQQTRSI